MLEMARDRRNTLAGALRETLEMPAKHAWDIPIRSKREKFLELLIGMPQLIRETIDATAAASAIPEEWYPELVRLPIGLIAHLRDIITVYPQMVGKPGDTFHVPKITTPEFSPLTAGTAPADVTHTISSLDVTFNEYGAKQKVDDDVIEDITGDVLEAIEQGFVDAALLKEDELIMDALDAVSAGSLAGTIYGGNATSEATVDSSDIFDEDLIADAIRLLDDGGYDTTPGNLVCVLAPVQYLRMMKDTEFKQANVFGSRELIETGQIPGWLGVELVKCGKINTGSGAGSPAITTYHAWVFAKNAVALVPKRELRIETDRKVEERQSLFMGTHRFGEGVLLPAACVRIITAA